VVRALFHHMPARRCADDDSRAACYNYTMKATGDVIILGGGVIGLTTAYFLAREGVSVILCDQSQTGTEASWAGAGILPPSDLEHARDPLDRLRGLSGRLFPTLSQELRERSGIDNGFVRCGGLEFVSQMGIAAPEEWYGEGIAKRVLTSKEVASLESELAPDLGDAIDVPGMSQLRNPRHLQALRAACLETAKVRIREGAAATGFVIENHRVKGVRLSGEVLSGDTVIVAAGAWTDRLLEPLGFRLNIQPVRGQIALLNPGRLLFGRILMWGARYLVPRLDGRVLIGSTEEHVGFDKATTAEGICNLLDLGVRLVPRLGSAALEKTWAGLRPGSPDGIPYIGTIAGIEKLYVAAGHFRAGIQLSPGTALLLKERILGQPLSIPMDAFRLNRKM
jgi:glycine oxidase